MDNNEELLKLQIAPESILAFAQIHLLSEKSDEKDPVREETFEILGERKPVFDAAVENYKLRPDDKAAEKSLVDTLRGVVNELVRRGYTPEELTNKQDQILKP